MRTTLRRDLTAALKARDRVAVAALRSALAAIENAEAAPAPDARTGIGDEHVVGAAVGVGAAEVARRELSDDELSGIVAAEVTDRLDAAQGYERHGRADAAAQLRAEAEVLRRYLRPA